MASASRSHRPIENLGDWVRDQEKRVSNEERRPNISRASDVMGPGLGPQAVSINNWNDEKTQFNGVFYTSGTAANVPRAGALGWIGTSWVDEEGFGWQEVSNYRDLGVFVPEKWVRQFYNINGSATFGAWVQVI